MVDDKPNYDPRRRDREGVGVAQNVAPIQDAVLAAIDAARLDVEQVARAIFADPEAPFEERRATERMTQLLAARGFAVERNVASLPTAFHAQREYFDDDKFRKGLQHGHVALIAESHADPRLGHVYGRHLSAGVALAAAIGLTAAFDHTSGAVSVIGAPGSGPQGGKLILASTGMFEHIDVAFGAHPSGVGRGALATFNGVGDRLAGSTGMLCFQARSDEGVPIRAAQQFCEEIAAYRAELDALESIVLALEAGPESITLDIRAATLGRVQELSAWLRARAEVVAAQTGCCVDATFDSPCPEMLVSRVMMRRVQTYAARVGLQTSLPQKAPPAAPDDWGAISQIAPTADCAFSVSDGPAEPGTTEFADASNTPQAYDQMCRMAGAIALAAVDVFTDINLRAVTDSELVRTLRGRGITRAHRRWTGVRPYVRPTSTNGNGASEPST